VKIISARTVYMYSKAYGTWIDSQWTNNSEGFM